MHMRLRHRWIVCERIGGQNGSFDDRPQLSPIVFFEFSYMHRLRPIAFPAARVSYLLGGLRIHCR
jgi:hypothetical protein